MAIPANEVILEPPVFGQYDAQNALSEAATEIGKKIGLEGGLLTGSLTVTDDLTVSADGAANIYLDAGPNGNGVLRFERTGVMRWRLGRIAADGKFTLTRYSAGGVLQDNPITVDSATGVVDFAHPPTIGAADWETDIGDHMERIESLKAELAALIRRLETLERR